MKILGIDPGSKGGFVLIDSTTREVHSMAMPLIGKEIDCSAIAQFVKSYNPEMVYIEKVHAMPGQGVTSMFNFGKAYGTVIGVIQGLGIPLSFVTPQAWKKVVLAGTNKDKDAAVHYVHSRLPNLELVQPRCRKPHDGIADAACIAEYGIKELKC